MVSILEIVFIKYMNSFIQDFLECLTNVAPVMAVVLVFIAYCFLVFSFIDNVIFGRLELPRGGAIALAIFIFFSTMTIGVSFMVASVKTLLG